MKSRIVKRSIAMGGRKTTVGLENEFWSAMKEIARDRHMMLSHIIATTAIW